MPRKKAAAQDTSLFEGTPVIEADRPKEPGPKIVEQAPAKRQEVVVPAKATKKGAQVVPIASGDPSNPVALVMSTFERMCTNPNVGPDKLGVVLDALERVLDRQAKHAFNEAFVLLAPNLPMVTKDGRIVVQEKDPRTGKRTGEVTQDTPYAKWETISPLIVPILSQHGFSIRHRTETAPDGKIRITAILYGHGHQEESYMDFELDTTGSKNNAQARVSATTYGRRITASTAINLVAKGEDDDGKASGSPVTVGDPLTPEELERLIEFAGAVTCSAPHLIAHLNKTRPKGHPEFKELKDLPRARFDEAVAALRSYEQNKQAREAAPKDQQDASK